VHCCHPSLANDNLSGMIIARALAQWLLGEPRRLSYRFLFIPGTIGSITWLARNDAQVSRIRHGLVLSCLGDGGGMTYKQSRRGNAMIDRVAGHVLEHHAGKHKTVPFIPYGYDERQYCSPGYNLPVGCLMRSPNGTFPEYHTSADHPEFVGPEYLVDSLEALKRIIEVIEHDGIFRNTSPYGEPQLGRRGLYRPIGGQQDAAEYDQMVLLWVLNLSDGGHSLLDIAERAGEPFHKVRAAADALRRAGLLEPASASA
jgi:aminopeptidase-like protein